MRRDRALLVVQPGAGSRWKVAPADLLARVIAPVVSGGDLQVLLHAGPADAAAAAQLVRAVESPMLTLVSPPLPVLAGVLSMAQAYLGGDSGVSHLAAAVGAPAVILFPAATRRRWAPWSPDGAAHPDGAGRRRGTPGRGRRRGGARRGYFCLAMIMPVILSYVGLGTIFLWTRSSLPLYGRPSMIFLA